MWLSYINTQIYSILNIFKIVLKSFLGCEGVEVNHITMFPLTIVILSLNIKQIKVASSQY